jgi:hypothetical protein
MVDYLENGKKLYAVLKNEFELDSKDIIYVTGNECKDSNDAEIGWQTQRYIISICSSACQLN